MIERVVATECALALIKRLEQQHGSLMFHCLGEGGATHCVAQEEFVAGAADLLLGEIGGCPFYIRKSGNEYWHFHQLIVDVIIELRGGAFSPEGVGFHTRSRLYSTEEWTALSLQPLH